MLYAKRLLQIVVVTCLLQLIIADVHRIVLKRQRGRNRNHKKRYIRDHRKKSPHLNYYYRYSPLYGPRVEDEDVHQQPFADDGFYKPHQSTRGYKGAHGWDVFAEPSSAEPIGFIQQQQQPEQDLHQTVMQQLQLQQQQLQQRHNIAELIDLTTSSPARLPSSPAPSADTEFGYSTIQSTETPALAYEPSKTVQIGKKRKKMPYELLGAGGASDPSADGHRIAYAPAPHSTYGLQMMKPRRHVPSSYGKRKRTKKLKRRAH